MPNAWHAMNRSDPATGPGLARDARSLRLLSPAERAEIQRQGAKAAARGEAVDANPFRKSDHDPSAASETSDRRAMRRAAWKRGHEAQAQARLKAPPVASHEDADFFA